MRAFQHLTVATEYVLSAAIGPPGCLPRRGSWPARRCNVGSGMGPHTADVAAFKPGPIMMLTPWTLIPGPLPARTCSTLWLNSTSPRGGRSRKGLGKVALSTAQIQSPTSPLRHIQGLKMSRYFSSGNASPSHHRAVSKDCYCN